MFERKKSMKIFGVDFKPITITLDTENKSYSIAFKRDCLGNIKILDFSIGEKGALFFKPQKIVVRKIAPKNKLDKVKEFLWYFKHYLKKKFHLQ